MALGKNSQKKIKQGGESIMEEFFVTMEKNRDHFTIHLHSVQSATALSALQDQDGSMSVLYFRLVL